MKQLLRRIIQALALFPAALGAQNLITNGGFESGNFGAPPSGFNVLSPGSTVITGWTVVTSEVGWGQNGNIFGVAARSGSRLIDLTDLNDVPPFGALQQTVSTTAGTVYRLSFYVGTQESTVAYRGPASVTASAGSVSSSVTFNPAGLGNQWGRFSMDFTALSGSTSIVLHGVSSAGGQYIGLDDVEVVSIDQDGDGMSDEYESANGLNPQVAADRNGDADGDGQTNHGEYVAGTAANSSTSVLTITSVQGSPASLTLTWTSVPGKTYRIERATGLNPWTDMGTAYPAAASPGGQTSATLVNPGGLPLTPRLFLRVRVEGR
jgi:hypothetical protein